jgi:shikimate kinase
MSRDRFPQPTENRGLALIGYRGTGKSTVGRIISERLCRPFLDMDLEVEARAGRTISLIFADCGEPVFRDWEERTLAELVEKFPGAVIATGGGAVLREANRRRIREFGYVVWLTAGPAEVARRLVTDRRGLMERPALTAAGTMGEIGELLSARTPLYRGLADTEIETGDKSPEEVATAVVTRWRGGTRS